MGRRQRSGKGENRSLQDSRIVWTSVVKSVVASLNVHHPGYCVVRFYACDVSAGGHCQIDDRMDSPT